MITDTDVLALAPGVSVSHDRLADAVRGGSWPLNPSGAFVLSRAGCPFDQIVRETAAAFSLSLEAARSDVLRFVWYLNGLALVNIERNGSRLRLFADWLVLAARLAPAGAVPAPVARRRALDTRSVSRAVAGSIEATLPRVLLVAAVAVVVTLHLAALAGSRGVVVPLVVGFGTGLGIGLHEAAHAACLRGVPSALVTRGRRTYVLHAPVDHVRRSLVAVAGPLTVVVLGTALVTCGTVLAAPVLVLAGCPLAAHALALTVVGGDGRVACGL